MYAVASAFLITEDLIKKLSCQIWGKLFKRVQFAVPKCVVAKISQILERFYFSVLIITRKWVYVNQLIKIVALKNLLLISFLGGFFLKPKLSKSFLGFCFGIFKINLVLPLGSKVINLKNLHLKNLKRKSKDFQDKDWHLSFIVLYARSYCYFTSLK